MRSAVSAPRHTRALFGLGLCLALFHGCEQPKVGGSGGNGTGSGGNGSGNGAGGNGAGGSGLVTPPSFPTAGTGGGQMGADAGPSAPPMGEECAAEEHDGKLVPLDLLFLLDTSGSMEETAANRSKWVAVRDALFAFMKDPGSAGLGVGLQLFPPPATPCMADDDCPGTFTDCRIGGICGGPADVPVTLQICDAGGLGGGCNGAVECLAYGTCSLSGMRCVPVGQPCAMSGVAGDMCGMRTGMCERSASSNALCSVADYATPAVAIADLPAGGAAIETALQKILPEGGTPMGPAVEGTLQFLTERATANTARRPVLVVASDGLPSGCVGRGNNILGIAEDLAAAQASAAKIPTYVIGVFNPAQLAEAQPALEQLATAGGTGTPYLLNAAADLGAAFLAALNQIRGAALGCEFMIPKPNQGQVDFGKVNVRVKLGAAEEDLGYVGSADKCDPTTGGWHYDADPASGSAPTRVQLCPASCEKVKADQAASVQLRFGCKTIVN